MRRRLIFFSIYVFLATEVCRAQQGAFDRWDRDKSGSLKIEELPEPLRKNFDRVDADKDGLISKKEHENFLKNRRGARPGGSAAGGMVPDGVKKFENLDYAGNSNERQKLDLYLPEKPEGEKLPLIVWIHGGGWQNGSKENARRILDFVKSGKFAGASIGYRLTDEAHWPAQIHDCKAAIRFLKANAEKYGYDPEKVGVWGSSAGGHLVAMLGVSHGVDELEGKIGAHLEQSSEVKCVVDYFGPTELLKMNEQGSSMDHDAANSPEGKLVGGAIQENKEGAKAASPIFYVSDDDEPILIVHGTKDPLVPHQQSVDFERKLEEVKVPATFISVKGGGHGPGFPPTVQDIVGQFLDFHLLGLGESPVDAELEAVEVKRR